MDGIDVAKPSQHRLRCHEQSCLMRWAAAWSTEQIANRLPIEFPYDGSLRISHEAITTGAIR
jgi:hypothetical protein